MRSLTFPRILRFLLGVCIIQLGVAFMLQSNIGSDPFTVFVQGLGLTLHITTGTANIIVLIVLIIAEFFIDKSRIKPGTIICAFFVGPILDVMVFLLKPLHLSSQIMILKMLFVLFGCFIVGIGLTLITESDLGVAPNDIVPFLVKDKLRVKYRTARVLMDSLYFVIGLLMHGVIGAGTVITVLCVGPCVQFWMDTFEKFHKKQEKRTA
ncbi:MAG: hypothetical protein E7256_02770 [Lachnospiraceae bacterium]|nr:hypothetical protein [Lachnospiraceae bacterium]